MNRRQSEKAARAKAATYNEQVLARHTQMRDEIMQLRPTWDRAKLEEVKQSYSGGLADILDQIKAADALEKRFGGAS